MTLFLKYKKEDKAHELSHSKGNVGIDLHCLLDDDTVQIEVGRRVLLNTGIQMEIPDGYAIIFKDRSGLAAKHGIHVLGGVIDSSYRGELKVCLVNLGESDYTVTNGDRICQMVVIEDLASRASLVEVHRLSDTERGEKGFGSSGK